MSIKHRLSRLEHRSVALAMAPSDEVKARSELGPVAREIREIDRRIEALDRDIAELESRMAPEELAELRAAGAELDRRLAEFGSLDEAIEWLESEIEAEGGEGVRS
jgi:prefoldin subunit 5